MLGNSLENIIKKKITNGQDTMVVAIEVSNVLFIYFQMLKLIIL